ncbi:FliG C-terminal domain-containing protein [Amnibacterium sp. CER49]|uniref:flagellar motor switch protein FliG n=1 Tax=Amnibacterium sp. CER49 TaxID=3039161 RepID=UPI002446A663|nr:FliG C-terminal domain-containing protein [Amnibacterium sp. CER49]MDH2443855.1 FliG C-terminal domain-containing protein [Amnibacterium sp. CER49]
MSTRTPVAPEPSRPGSDVAVRTLSGVQKAALVLMNMSTERAAVVLRSFGEAEAEEITAEMARMRSTDGRDAEEAIRQFQEQVSGRTPGAAARSGKQVAADLIQATFEPERAAGLLERIATSESSASFAFLESLEPSAIVPLLAAETAETVAFVLVQLGPDLAAKILMLQDPERKLDIAQCVATMGTPVPEAGGIVADVLRRRARAAAASPTTALDEEDPEAPAPLRVQPLVDIMNHAEPAAESELLAGLQGRDKQLADEVRAKMLAFEDLPRLQDRDLQQLLRGIAIPTLAVALKGAHEDVAAAVRANMSERNREALAEETTELGRVLRSRVDEARQGVVRALRALAANGLDLKPAGGAAAVSEAEGNDEATAEPEEEYVD